MAPFGGTIKWYLPPSRKLARKLDKYDFFFWKEDYSAQCHKLKFIFGKAIYREIDSLHHTVTCRQVADKHKIISNYCRVAWCSIVQWTATTALRRI